MGQTVEGDVRGRVAAEGLDELVVDEHGDGHRHQSTRQSEFGPALRGGPQPLETREREQSEPHYEGELQEQQADRLEDVQRNPAL